MLWPSKTWAYNAQTVIVPLLEMERGGLVVNASDFGFRGRGFEPHSGQTVLCPLARHIYSPKVLVIPRKRWLRPNMTEKVFTGTLRINQPTFLEGCFTIKLPIFFQQNRTNKHEILYIAHPFSNLGCHGSR